MLILKLSIWRIDINDTRMQLCIEYTLQKPIIVHKSSIRNYF
jgi:hypothetical protein